MGLLALFYRIQHPHAQKIPNVYTRSLLGQLWHTIRKAICQNIGPNCVANFMRVNLYRLCGFKIGKDVFIGMKCYFDDSCPGNIILEDKVGVSYGVYFSCHGENQELHKVILKYDCHIGFRSSIVANDDITIGERAMVGAKSLVTSSIPSYTTAVGVPCRVIKQEGYSRKFKNPLNQTTEKMMQATLLR